VTFGARQRPPRLVVRTLIATFCAIAVVLGAALITLTIETRLRVKAEVAANLDASQRAFALLESRRQKEAELLALNFADSPTLKAALDTYQAETRRSGSGDTADLVATVQHEVEKLSLRVSADAVVVAVPGKGRDVWDVLASGGARSAAWPRGTHLPAAGDVAAADSVVAMPAGTFRVVSAIVDLQGVSIGRLLLATSLDDRYAKDLSALSRARTAVIVNGRLIASNLDPERKAALAALGTLPAQGIVQLGADQQAVRQLFRSGNAGFYAVDSIGAAAAQATTAASEAILVIALGALGLGAVVSLWLARVVARPIDHLSQELRRMTSAREFSRRLPLSGSSQELDALTGTFNEMMTSLVAAEDETEAAYVAAIKALAAALDARDPYTSGHSERVSALAVMVGRHMTLADDEIEVLRLGALLHDIGKIGIRDRVLSKRGPLTDEEFEIIKTHPTVGANILRHVPFLTRHMPIVELHHEQPDGRGYPHGLFGHATPLLARIVHVADAFDAMTSARAYRPAQGESHALAELTRHRGTQFDPEVVDAFMAAWRAQGGSDGMPSWRRSWPARGRRTHQLPPTERASRYAYDPGYRRFRPVHCEPRRPQRLSPGVRAAAVPREWAPIRSSRRLAFSRETGPAAG
jgi:putative nucleotidyltransferase with HDIG domain